MVREMATRLLVDGHVHMHDRYDERAFIAAAKANLSSHGEGMPALLLAEMDGHNYFKRWRTGQSELEVAPTEEGESLILCGQVLVVAGRQIVTSERIEVLALLSDKMFKDGRPLEETLRATSDAGATAVLPWGAGKWIGNRGRLVADAAERHGVMLGDNAGRPVGWPAPGIFRRHIVLPGTDTLRMPGQQHRVGRYGFELGGCFDLSRPAEGIRAALEQLRESPKTLGRRSDPLTFLRQQIGLRLHK
jgi:hypothetical protein